MTRLEPMNSDRLPAWAAAARAQYVQERIAAGDTPDAAEQNAARSIDVRFPGGVAEPDQHVYDVVHDGEELGYLWIGPIAPETPDAWWVWDIEIDRSVRGRGIGRATMLLAESEARRLGAKTLGLNVFGHNAAARALYESLDYVTTSVQMRKDL